MNKVFITSPVIKVRASQGIWPSARNIFKLSSADSRSESLNSYCEKSLEDLTLLVDNK